MIIGMFEHSDIINCTITTIIVVTKWFLWKARNNKKFNNAQFEQNQILKTIRLSLVEFVSIKMFNKTITKSEFEHYNNFIKLCKTILV